MHAHYNIIHEYVHLFIALQEVGVFEEKRRQQRKLWLWTHIDWQLEQRQATTAAAAAGLQTGGGVLYTVEPLNSGHVGTRYSVC